MWRADPSVGFGSILTSHTARNIAWNFTRNTAVNLLQRFYEAFISAIALRKLVEVFVDARHTNRLNLYTI
jgi:hypothetical protein